MWGGLLYASQRRSINEPVALAVLLHFPAPSGRQWHRHSTVRAQRSTGSDSDMITITAQAGGYREHSKSTVLLV